MEWTSAGDDQVSGMGVKERRAELGIPGGRNLSHVMEHPEEHGERDGRGAHDEEPKSQITG